MNIKIKKNIKNIFTKILIIAIIFNLFSFNAYSQKNELYIKHETTDYLNFGDFILDTDEYGNIKYSLGSYNYKDGGSGTGDLSLKYDNLFNVKAGRIVSSSGYSLVLSGWTYEDGGGAGTNLGWIQTSNFTENNNTQNPISKDTFLGSSDDQNSTNYGLWINSDSKFNGKGKVDSDGTFATFTGSSAVSPKPFDIDGDGLHNLDEYDIFLSQNNVGNIDGDGFTDGEKDWDSDGDGFNDKIDPFPMDPNKHNCTLTIKPSEICNLDGTIKTDDNTDTDGDGLSDFLEYQFGTDSNNTDTDGDGLSDFLEYQFGLDGNNGSDASLDYDEDGISNKSEIIGQQINITYTDTGGFEQTFSGTIITDLWNADTDLDGLFDLEERVLGTIGNNPDVDGDGIPDGPDTCPLDGQNSCDTSGNDLSDNDNDGLPAWWEDKYKNGKNSDRLNPQDTDNTVIQNDGNNGDISISATGSGFNLSTNLYDSNNNLIPDPFEDFDLDGMPNIEEYKYGTNPNNWDSDGDHLSDYEEIANNTDPNSALNLNIDQDGDSLSNVTEIDGRIFDLKYKNTSCVDISELNKKVSTKYYDKDSDNDGLLDNEEKMKLTNPLSNDTDGDGYSDGFETITGYNPLNGCFSDNNAVPIDNDRDGLLNKFETKYSQCGEGASDLIYSMTGSFQDGFSSETINCEVNDYKLIDIDNIGAGNNPDSDGDGIYDKDEDFDNDGLNNYEEQLQGSSPIHWDTDGDGIPDNMDPNPNDSIEGFQDTDGDGISDKTEILGIDISYTYKKDISSVCTDLTFDEKISLNYKERDSDNDGLDDQYELQNSLNPIESDIDGDGWLDGEEINIGTDPKNGCPGSGNIPEDNDGDGLAKIFEDKYTKGGLIDGLVFVLEKIGQIYKSNPLNGDSGNQTKYGLIDLINGENPNSDNDELFDGSEDFDNDGLTNKIEQKLGTDPNNWDTDGDGIPDNLDNKPNNSGSILTITGNIFNEDINEKIYGIDSDKDGLSDVYEAIIGTNPNNNDSDGDGIPDGIEDAANRLGDTNLIPIDTDGDYLPDVFEDLYDNFDKNNNDGNLGAIFGGNFKIDGFEDNDNDGLINIFELIYGTDPENNDTDGDGVLDGVEITASKLGDLNGNPINSQKKPMDSDKDGLSDIYEETYSGVLNSKIKNFVGETFFDNDDDLLNNFEEQKRGTNPNKKDSDSSNGTTDFVDIFPNDIDNMGFFTEAQMMDLLKTIDSDSDGISDYEEVNTACNISTSICLDPYNPDSDGDGILDGIETILSKSPYNDTNSNPLDSTKTSIDSDGDLLPDLFEQKIFTQGIIFEKNLDLGNYFKMNHLEENTYSENIIDAFADADFDGLSNINELLKGTNPYNQDSDGNGILDGDELENKINILSNENLIDYILPLDGDYDSDGVSNIEEYDLGTNPRIKDSDGDGIEDGIEIAMEKFWGDENGNPLDSSKTPIDSDSDGIPDLIESYYSDSKYSPGFKNSTNDGGASDYDSDGLSNIIELVKNTNPFDWDTDNDGVTDGVDGNPNSGNLQGDYNLYLDSDGDGLSDKYEISMIKNFGGYGLFDELDSNLPASGWDTDGDLLSNLFEDFNHENGSGFTLLNKNDETTYNSGTNPVGNGNLSDKYFDIDGDTLSNLDELLNGTNPYSSDTDSDGINDNLDTNPIAFGNGVDSDMDGIPDFTEIHGFTGTVLILDNGIEDSKIDYEFFTNPLKYDSDGDGLSDGFEIDNNLNPLLKDTDNDGWDDGIEINVSYINSVKGNPNDKSIFPTDTDGDGLADEWEEYYTNPDNLTTFNENGDNDGDGIPNIKEQEIGSDPTINNFIAQIEINDLKSTGDCNWSNTGQIISIISPLNLNNLDKNNSGFFNYETKGTKYGGGETAINNIFQPIGTGEWINNNQNLSSINGALVSELLYANNNIPLGPNKLEIIIKADSYRPHVGFKTIDLISGLTPDPLMEGNELESFSYEQEKNEKDIYLGESCVDATPPVCGVILSGGNHEQNHGLKIPVEWQENTGWKSLDLTSSGKNLSLLGTNDNIDGTTENITIFNTFKKIFSILGFGSTKYTGNFDKNKEGYIPWTRGTGTTTLNVALNYSDSYKDNLSGLKESKVKMLNKNEKNNWTTGSGNNLRSNISDTSTITSYAPANTNQICRLDTTVSNSSSCEIETDLNGFIIGETGYSGKKASIKIFDKAGNYSYCTSGVSKVDDSFPLARINSIKDTYSNTNILEFATKQGTLLTNRGYTFNFELNDRITYLNDDNETYKFSFEGDNTINGNSGFNPYYFGSGKLMYCGASNDAESCITDILANENDENYINTKYLYSSTGSTSSGIFAKGEGELIYENGIMFEKDATFEHANVILTGSTLSVESFDKETGIINRGTDGKIIISDGTGSVSTNSIESQILIINSGTNSGTYLSTLGGIYRVDDTGTSNLVPDGIKILNKNKVLGETENPVLKGKVAIKIYSQKGTNAPSYGDMFYLNFNFTDRAGNGLPLKYGFILKENVFAKILGNIQSTQDTSVFDSNVQEFRIEESAVKNNVEKIKTNISDIITNAKDLNGSGIVVEELADLNEYRISLGDEDIYIVKNGNIILGTGSTTLNLNTGKAISIISYGGNILFNSKYINSTENTAFVSLVNPYLAQNGGSHTLESQGNILINPELLIGKGQLIAEGSIMSYANWDGKIETMFDMNSRKSIFKNQLIWDGTMISNNTVGGYHQGTCPVSIYGLGNRCGFRDNNGSDLTDSEIEQLQTISLTYDLHYLRTHINEGAGSLPLGSTIEAPAGNTTRKMSEKFAGNSELSSKINQITPGLSIEHFNVIKNIDSIDAPERLKTIVNGIKSLYEYPVVIKHSVPSLDMKIFK